MLQTTFQINFLAIRVMHGTEGRDIVMLTFPSIWPFGITFSSRVAGHGSCFFISRFLGGRSSAYWVLRQLAHQMQPWWVASSKTEGLSSAVFIWVKKWLTRRFSSICLSTHRLDYDFLPLIFVKKTNFWRTGYKMESIEWIRIDIGHLDLARWTVAWSTKILGFSGKKNFLFVL